MAESQRLAAVRETWFTLPVLIAITIAAGVPCAALADDDGGVP
jgi:hypothetical protein